MTKFAPTPENIALINATVEFVLKNKEVFSIYPSPGDVKLFMSDPYRMSIQPTEELLKHSHDYREAKIAVWQKFAKAKLIPE